MGLYPVRGKPVNALDEQKATITTAATMLAGMSARNPGTSDVWMLAYNATLGNVSLGTTEPIARMWVPADGYNSEQFPHPVEAFTALTVAAAPNKDGSGGAISTDIEAMVYYCQGVV